MITPFVAGRLPWESEEAVFLKKVKRAVESLFRYTELEMDELTNDELRILLRNCGNDINNIIRTVEDEVKRLIERDTAPNAGKVCKICEKKKIYMCSRCTDTWFKNFDEKYIQNRK